MDNRTVPLPEYVKVQILLGVLNNIMKKNIVYVDSSYDWNTTIKGRGTGTICVIYNGGVLIQEKELCYPHLKQLNNKFELFAIQRGLELGGKNCKVYSDSRVAVKWIEDKRVQWIGRDENKAGIYLERFLHLDSYIHI